MHVFREEDAKAMYEIIKEGKYSYPSPEWDTGLSSTINGV